MLQGNRLISEDLTEQTTSELEFEALNRMLGRQKRRKHLWQRGQSTSVFGGWKKHFEFRRELA